MEYETMVHGIVDIEIDIYKECFNAEEVTDWGDDVVTISCNVGSVMDKLQKKIWDYRMKLPLNMVTLALSDSTNFRKTVDPSYKANRKNVRKPVGLKAVKDNLQKICNWNVYKGCEADDVIGIRMTDPRVTNDKYQHKWEAIGISTDKDLLTVPGKLWRGDWDNFDVMEITQFEADYNWMIQTLTGDTTDGYSGCKGIGKVTAAKLLAKCETFNEMWKAVVKAFGNDEDAAIQSARLARILRWGDFDAETNEVILWEPK